MKKLWSTSAVLVFAASVVVATSLNVKATPDPGGGQVMTVRQHAFYSDLRKLWEDHITWTRCFIVSAIGDLPDAPVAAGRLLRNQVDLGDAIKPFYGDAAGAHLTDLLTDHILIAAAIINAAKVGDAAEVGAQLVLWYANADEIADFLSSANPKHGPKGMMRQMMKDHLDLTLGEAVAQLTGDFATSVAKYDAVHLEALEMSDMLAEGIIAQYPKQFGPGH